MMNFNIADFYNMGLSAGNKLAGLTQNLNKGDAYIPTLLENQSRSKIADKQIASQEKISADTLKADRLKTMVTESAANRREKARLKSSEAEGKRERVSRAREGYYDRKSAAEIADKQTSRAMTAATIAASQKGINDPLTLARQAAQAGITGGIPTPFGPIGRRKPTMAEIQPHLQNVLGSISQAMNPGASAGAAGGPDIGKILLSNPPLARAFGRLSELKQTKGAVGDEDLAMALGPDLPEATKILQSMNMNIEDILAYINS